MKKFITIALSAGLMCLAGSVVAQAKKETKSGAGIDKTAKQVAHATASTAKKVGNGTASAATKVASKVTDKVSKNKVGPAGQTMYIDNHGKYYYVDYRGKKVYVIEARLKNK